MMYIPVGPVYGSVLYDIWGQALPFMALAVIILATIGKYIRIIVSKPLITARFEKVERSCFQS